MRILFLSSTAWANDNSFGNTYSNVFGGMEDVEIANIYCRYGVPDYTIVKKHFQITEKSLIKNMINKNFPSGSQVFDNNQSETLNSSQKIIVNHIRNYRFQIYYWIRDLIWKIGRWKSAELIKFIDDFNPDLIFLPLYYSTYLNDIALFIKKHTNIPMVCWISDDNYTLKQFNLSPLYWIDRMIKRNIIKKVVEKCEYLYVIVDIQKKDYERCFKKECKILTKGADFSVCALKEKISFPLKIVYTGNLGARRWLSLAKLANVLSTINETETKAQLYIYTTTPMTKKMKTAFDIEKTVLLMPLVPSEEIPQIQKSADILVHVEAPGLKERMSVRHSFSTKLVDYFYAARCIFVIGPKDATPIDYLIKNDAAIVAATKKEIKEKLHMIITNPKIIEEYSKKAWECGRRNHQIKNIQKKLLEDFRSLITSS